MGNRLKDLRVEANMTQKQLADKLGLAVSAISSYESGARYPTYSTLIRLTGLFHVSSDYLLGLSAKREIDVSGLTDHEIQAILQLIEVFQESRSESQTRENK